MIADDIADSSARGDELYLLGLHYRDARRNGSGDFSLLGPDGALPRWTLLPATDASRELLELAALVCAGLPLVRKLPGDLGRWCGPTGVPLRLEALVTPHEPRDERYSPPERRRFAVQIASTGKADSLPTFYCASPPRGVRLSNPRARQPVSRWFFLAYGAAHGVHQGTDQFDFADPFFRLSRFGSLFDREARLTDPVAFLSRLQYKGLRKSRYPALRTLARLADVAGDVLDIDLEPAKTAGHDLERWWSTLPAWKRRTLVPALDAVRHAVDASPFQSEPLDIPCPILIERPDSLFGPRAFPAWALLWDRLFPRAQFVVTLEDEARAGFPRDLLSRVLPVPEASQERPRTPQAPQPKAHPGAVALVQVDGALPNLALMKLARYFRTQGRKVVLTRRGERIAGAEAAWASSVFPSESSAATLAKLGDGTETRSPPGARA